jgi:hypothetical protein
MQSEEVTYLVILFIGNAHNRTQLQKVDCSSWELERQRDQGMTAFENRDDYCWGDENVLERMVTFTQHCEFTKCH